ncbi:DsrE family protein [Hydrogenophaga sp.]|uniref:DsrE family protein n=1 Tax=Hydrogenophaga sp. TaxID=1904254 RepID=UPI0035634C33
MKVLPTTPAATSDTTATPPERRRWLGRLLALSTLPALGSGASAASSSALPLRLGADEAPHKIVYQLNRAEPEYQEAIFNSISAMLKKYVDDVAIAVVAWGPGIHLLAKTPQRPVPELMQQRARSMAQAYGVRFIACGNTMQSLGWTAADMLDFAQIEDVGAAAVMELQEKGYAYLAW